MTKKNIKQISSNKDCRSANLPQQAHLHDVHAQSATEINARIKAAEKICALNGARFTPLRRNVYELILQADRPLGAYELIQSLQSKREKNVGKQAKMVAPPTIYRTLDFLLELGFIHQLTSINAFVPCCHPRDEHTAVFLMCNNCQRVQEGSSLPMTEVVNQFNNQVGFKVEQSVMELKGICRDCLNKDSLDPPTDNQDTTTIDGSGFNKG